MTNQIFDQELTLSLQRLEDLWQRVEELPKSPEEMWRQTEEFQQQQELLKASLEELTHTLEELQVAIDEIHQQQDELAASRLIVEAERQCYQELFEEAPDGYFVTTKEGAIRQANRVAAQLLNISQEYLISKPLVLFVAAEERADFNSKLSQLQKGESLKNWQLHIQPRHGACFRASLAVTSVQDSQGEVVGLRWRMLELTEEEQESKAAGESGKISYSNLGTNNNLHPLTPSSAHPLTEAPSCACLFSEPRSVHTSSWATPCDAKILETFNDILSSSPDCFCVLDKTGKYIYVNRATAQAVGKAQSDFIGKTWQELEFPTEIMERFDTQREAVFATGQPVTDAVSFPTVEGVREYEYTISKISSSDINGATEAVVTTAKDVTKYKQAIATAREALAKEAEYSSIQSHFTSIVSHELRNPLNNIACCAKLLESRSQQWSEEKKLNYLERIQVNVKQINQLLDDLLLIRKAQTGELQVKPALVDTTEFCCNLIEQLKQGAGSNHKITCITKGQRSGVWDEKLLRRILMNLLLNAVKYSPEGSEIKLNVVCHKKQAIFRIQDSGIGIPQQDQDLLFKAFHRGSNVGAISGSGLGLTIVKQCVDLHKGEISVESKVEVGSTFTVTLPMNQR